MAKIDIENIQVIALAAVEAPDFTDIYRNICRWYSKEYSTPLHYVENDIPVQDVLRHYYEEQFYTMKRSDNEALQIKYAELKYQVMRGNAGNEEDEALTEAEDDDWERQMLEEIEEQYKKAQVQEAAKTAKKVEKVNKVDSLENPNIEDEVEFGMVGESTPPDFPPKV